MTRSFLFHSRIKVHNDASFSKLFRNHCGHYAAVAASEFSPAFMVFENVSPTIARIFPLRPLRLCALARMSLLIQAVVLAKAQRRKGRKVAPLNSQRS